MIGSLIGVSVPGVGLVDAEVEVEVDGVGAIPSTSASSAADFPVILLALRRRAR